MATIHSLHTTVMPSNHEPYMVLLLQDAGQEDIKGKGLMSTYYCDPTAAATDSSLAAVLDKVRAASIPSGRRRSSLMQQQSL